jgi:hypothetical protein
LKILFLALAHFLWVSKFITDKSPQDWFSIFCNQIVGGAIMDQLVSGAVKLIVTSGQSFRKEGTFRNQISDPAASEGGVTMLVPPGNYHDPAGGIR